MDVTHNIQYLKGLLIAAELQQRSDNFLKINDISYCSSPLFRENNFVVNSEYMDVTLAEAFKTRTISLDEKIQIFFKLIKGVSEMEDAGIVHTNLSPTNILLSNDLQKVKICGLVNNALLSTDVVSYHVKFGQYTGRNMSLYIRNEDFMFRPIELLAHDLSQKVPKTSSAMDVWSLGCIFAYMLLDGVSIFGNFEDLDGRKAGSFVYTTIFQTLGYPTREEYDALHARYHMLGTSGQLLHNLQEKLPKDTNTTKWIPVLEAMLNYRATKRITTKQLLNHSLFKERFKSYDHRLSDLTTSTAKMVRISIEMPQDFPTWKPKDIRAFFKALLGTRGALLDEKRKDLIVLACNLGNATPVPAELWITIFMYADTKPIMYALPANAKLHY
eukprot:TRINITY_DN10050_c0_g1_i1.p1 TRINITY_DN10050_c0_g1~~TRINITY_DN10050_c0_g1_i1.p1  ORF type:complete len:405 (-),score=6.30 TRINITY_DN10050_c0_g1_i1:15-1172(-)